MFEKALTTPVRKRYAEQLQEGYDIKGLSHCFDVYRKPQLQCHTSGLDMLANVPAKQKDTQTPGPSSVCDDTYVSVSILSTVSAVSPLLAESLIRESCHENESLSGCLRNTFCESFITTCVQSPKMLLHCVPNPFGNNNELCNKCVSLIYLSVLVSYTTFLCEKSLRLMSLDQ